MVSITIRMVYGSYCKRHFQECRYSLIIDKQLIKDMTGFAGWGSTSSIVWIFNTQGINILSNIFFGVVVNAARGVATQVEGIVKGFVVNFTTAVRPQIINHILLVIKNICLSYCAQVRNTAIFLC